MTTDQFYCMDMDCMNKVERHPYNFDNGFCPSCKEKKNKQILKILEQ